MENSSGNDRGTMERGDFRSPSYPAGQPLVEQTKQKAAEVANQARQQIVRKDFFCAFVAPVDREGDALIKK